MANNSDEEGGGRSGPKPERLWIPHQDWKDAVREALEIERPADNEEKEEERDDATA